MCKQTNKQTNNAEIIPSHTFTGLTIAHLPIATIKNDGLGKRVNGTGCVYEGRQAKGSGGDEEEGEGGGGGGGGDEAREGMDLLPCIPANGG